MNKLGIIILNYLNWEDTIECVNSIKGQSNKDIEIVIVDNFSNNNSFEILNQKFSKEKNIHVLMNSINGGYAKGNNLGIQYCIQKLGINNVLVINNDTLFEDETYLDTLFKTKFEGNVGAIGTRIIGSDYKNQNPIFGNISFISIVKKFLTGLAKLIGIRKPKMLKKQSKHKTVKKAINDRDLVSSNNLLHGSAILLTENYLKEVGGFFPETFLYYEENILGIIMTKLNLKMIYLEEPYIYHKEDQSSLLSFNNDNKIQLKYELSSILIALKLKLTKIESIKKRMKKVDYLVK